MVEVERAEEAADRHQVGQVKLKDGRDRVERLQVGLGVRDVKDDVERSTGYILGGVSPLGQKKALHMFIDLSAKNYDSIYVSAGRRGLEIELSPDDLQTLTHAKFVKLRQ